MKTASATDAKASAGFAALRGGGFILVTPLDEPAQAWLHAHIDIEATWTGETLVVESSFLPQLAEAMTMAGFRLHDDI